MKLSHSLLTSMHRSCNRDSERSLIHRMPPLSNRLVITSDKTLLFLGKKYRMISDKTLLFLGKKNRESALVSQEKKGA
jgi:hypothetical protein